MTAHPTMDALAADPRVEIVVIGLPNEAHLEATGIAASHGKAVICTKPLARTEREAAQMLKIVVDAGVWHGYAESAVFSPKIAKAYEMLKAGGIGKLLTMRAREGHSGPHAPISGTPRRPEAARCSTWDATPSNRPAISSARITRSSRSSAWGATLKHADKTSGEDACIALLKFAGGELASLEILLDRNGRHGTSPRTGRI